MSNDTNSTIVGHSSRTSLDKSTTPKRHRRMYSWKLRRLYSWKRTGISHANL